MKKLPVLIFFIFILIFSLFSPKIALGATLFHDDFESNNLTKWGVIGGKWTLHDFQGSKWMGASADPFSDYEIQAGSFSWSDYEFSVDVLPKSGVDKNIFFRVNNQRSSALLGHNLPVAYGLHLTQTLLELQKWTTESGQLLNSVSMNFSTNVVAKITVRTEGQDIKIFRDGSTTPAIHYIDNNNPILNGRIALAMITGNSSSKVWFDNVMVTSLEEEAKEPIVLLPGHGASWCLEAMITGSECENWKMTPFVKVYDNLITTLENAGYKQNESLFIFYYDWRKKVDEIADDFNNFMDSKIPSEKQATLIGHSMGGLVGRAYLQKTADPPVEKLITIGSPHEGVPIAYPAWEGGEIWNDKTWQWVALQLFLQIHKKGFKTNMEAIRHLAPSTKDFLPIFNYLKKNGQEIDVDTMHQQNEWLKGLTTTSLLTTIVGRNQDTLSAIQVKDRDWLDELLDKWEDGEPVNKEYLSEGDGTVLLKSATISGVSVETLDLNHSALVSEFDGIAKIVDLLSLSIAPDTAVLVPPRTPSLVFFLHSPAKIQLKTPFEKAIYSPEDNLLVLPGAEAGEYEIEIIGTGTGTYHLEIGQLTEKEDIWQTVSGEIESGKSKTLKIDFNPQKPKENPLVDETGSLSLEIGKTKIDELKDYVNKLSIRRSIKNRILYNLNKMLRQIGRAENSRNVQRTLVYLYNLRITLNYWQKYNLIPENENIYIKNNLEEIAGYLENSYVILMNKSGKAANTSRIQGGLNTIKRMQAKLELKIKKPNQALVYKSTEEKLEKAQEKFDSHDYFASQILSFSARFLALEVSRLVR